MKKNLCRFLVLCMGIYSIALLATLGHSQSYPYPQNYTVDQRRFDTQQAANLTMRRLQTSTTGQWAIGVISLDGTGASISTATYGMITSTGATVISPSYTVKKYSLLSIGGLTTITTNKTDGTLNLDDGMSYEQAFDYGVTPLVISVNVSTGVLHYAITGVK